MKLDITTLFDSALIMFIPVLAGIAAARLGYFKDGFSKKLSAFVLNIAQPFMLVTSMLGLEYSEENLRSGLVVLACRGDRSCRGCACRHCFPPAG